MRVELLYSDGCPSHEMLRPQLEALLAGTDAELVLQRIDSPEDAEKARFLGSPSVRVDGRDVDPDASARQDFGMKCRIYRSEEGQTHTPPERWLHQALTGE